MFPVICRIGPIEVYSFGVMIAVAAVLCSFLMAREGRAFGIKPDEIYDLVFWAALGGIIGARIFYVVLNFSVFLAAPLEIFMINHGGLAWQGGFLFGTAAVVIIVRRQKRPLLFMADFLAPYLVLGHAIGRIGCFLNGCCYGKEFSGGMYFPVHEATLYPTQLYEAAALVGVFFVLKWLRTVWKKTPGAIFSVYLMMAAFIRFIVEFFRADHQLFFLDLSIFQYVSFLFFLVGLLMFFLVRRNRV